MPHHFLAFREDVRLNAAKIPSPARSIAALGRIPFWWMGEWFVEDPASGELSWASADVDPTRRRWADHEYSLERSRGVWEAFPVLRGWGVTGVEFRSPEQSHAIGLALAELAKDENAPSADGVAIAARFMLLAGNHGCYTKVSGI